VHALGDRGRECAAFSLAQVGDEAVRVFGVQSGGVVAPAGRVDLQERA
jgi:hypothetical protein